VVFHVGEFTTNLLLIYLELSIPALVVFHVGAGLVDLQEVRHREGLAKTKFIKNKNKK
jgi:hypothetical protein